MWKIAEASDGRVYYSPMAPINSQEALNAFKQSRNDLAERLRTTSGHGARIPDRLVPTSFDPNDPELSGFPRSRGWRWGGAERMLRTPGITFVLMRVPRFWQVEPYLNAACRAAHVPFFPNEPENMPVGAAALREIGAAAVVSEGQDALQFSSFLAEREQALPATWLLVHPVDAANWDLPVFLSDDLLVFEEVHLFPGVPVLEQCETLAQQRRHGVFHLSDAYTWNVSEAPAYVTGSKDDPVPLEHFALPFSVHVLSEQCACGKNIVQRSL